jgi:GDP-fucose transporter C1
MANASRAAIAAVVSAYFVVSIALVFSNKVLVTEGVSIPAPIFVTWFQCVLTVLIIWLLGRLSYSHSDSYPSLKEFPVQSFEFATAKKVLPLSIIFVVSILSLAPQLLRCIRFLSLCSHSLVLCARIRA